MKLALAQLNPLVGDLVGNAKRIKTACLQKNCLNADLVLTPELSLWGYPPRDLLLNPQLIDMQEKLLTELSNTLLNQCPKLKVLVGIAEPTQDLKIPKLFNSIALVESTGWKVIARKRLLPSYDVFDEKRYFRSGKASGFLKIRIKKKVWNLGITICEDLWVEEEIQGHQLSGPDPIAELIPNNIDLLINLSASPFSHSKENLRQQIATKAAKRLNCQVVYLNQVGGNDELVFDGSSFIINKHAEVAIKLPSCKEMVTSWDIKSKPRQEIIPSFNQQEQLFKVLTLGVHDYAIKCGFNNALIGLSGGIDSALVAIIAAAALGAQNVTAVLMPSPWSSQGSITDALALTNRIGITTHTIPITTLMQGFDSALAVALGTLPEGVTAENLQSRIRGTILMALANQQRKLLLSTGNKSELAVGYCTLYGDMNGGLSVIGDLYKTHVFELCEWLDSQRALICRNMMGLPEHGALIGRAIREKPPSAELRPGQLDRDSLPDYSVLDPILKALIEDRHHSESLIKNGQDPLLVNKVVQMIRKGEFKRRQAPPMLKVSHQAFGSGWRLPIAAK